ncbi:regulator of G protein-like protein [Rhexocercosporidium sp. MPI-PUGE-AT-0058]|nr:regulator of G protein-like protein [Rhexocercosporidium sp. MPI-PUGE-AT-0058]
MSGLFYRQPDYSQMNTGPINEKDCARYIQRTKNSERAIPEGLSFEDVISNRALPQCSLNDFMNYLYEDYVRRFDALSEAERVLSPVFVPETDEIPDLTKDAEKGERRKTKREIRTAMMETGYDRKGTNFSTSDSDGHHRGSRVNVNNEDDHARSPSVASGSNTVPSDAEVLTRSVTIQPMREEINRVMRHCLAFTAPQELKISHSDRAKCLHALQHTTHHSAFALAVKIAEATLRGQSHPNFIRWSICNGNKPRVFFVRTMGVTNIVLGFIIAIVITLSTAYQGLCVILHHSHARNLRPWEQDPDSEIGDMRQDSSVRTENRTVQLASLTSNNEDQHRYQRKPLMRKAFDTKTCTQDETLRVLRDKIVMGANIWVLIVTIPLTVAFVALPNGNFF